LESSLLEIPIEGERRLNSDLSHYCEAGAVGETPRSATLLEEQFARGPEMRRSDPNQLGTAAGIQTCPEVSGAVWAHPLAQEGENFVNYVIRRNESAMGSTNKRTLELDRGGMVSIPYIGGRQPGACIHEDHFFFP
jgi:hypothetical protein